MFREVRGRDRGYVDGPPRCGQLARAPGPTGHAFVRNMAGREDPQ
jgi:hypothetical protein